VQQTSRGYGGYEAGYSGMGAVKEEKTSEGGGDSSQSFVVRMRGLPWSCTEEDVRQFFAGIDLAKILMTTDDTGRFNGEALVEFTNEENCTRAMALSRKSIGTRYIELFRSSYSELVSKTSGPVASTLGGPSLASSSYSAPSNSYSSGTPACIRMRGLPWDAGEPQITAFFQEAGVIPVRVHTKDGGGEAFVEFSSSSEVTTAMTRHKALMGRRYIELFRIPYAEVASIVGLPQTLPAKQSYNQSAGYESAYSQAGSSETFAQSEQTSYVLQSGASSSYPTQPPVTQSYSYPSASHSSF